MKAKKAIKKLAGKIKELKKKLRPGEIAIKGATVGLFISAVIAIVVVTIIYTGKVGFLPATIVTLSILLVAFITGFLINHAIRLISKIPFWLFTALLSVFPITFIAFYTNLHGVLLTYLLIIITAALIGSSVYMIARSWKKHKAIKKTITLAMLATGIFIASYGIVWLMNPGTPLHMPPNAALSAVIMPDHISLDNPGEQGEYEVAHLTYGSGSDIRRKEYGENVDIITESVDGSIFLNSWAGFSGKMRTNYFGFEKDSLPLNARVWHPVGEGPFPLVLIVHGNHLAQEFSDPGYAYLGELLASRGFIAVSVDQNFLNGSFTNLFQGIKNENDARGWLLLKHLQQWDSWTNDSESILYKMADLENIALIGHSRGGEAVAHAALFNKLPFYPDNAKQEFDFNFNIKAIIAIAPSDGQYQPGGLRTPLTDINYLTLQGSHDADVSSYQGMRQFNRVEFSEDYSGFKAGVYIWGANHGQFNSVWGNKDLSSPQINFFNLEQLIPEEEQQQISLVYISAFLETTLNNKNEYQKLFIDYRSGIEWLPETIYQTQYEQSNTQFIANFSEDLNLSTASLPESEIKATDLSIWREQQLALNWGDYNSRVVVLGWNTSDNDSIDPKYCISFKPESITTNKKSSFVFHMCDTGENAPSLDDNKQENEEGNAKTTSNNNQGLNYSNEDKVTNSDNEENEFIDFRIQLSDKNNNIISFNLSDCSPLQPPLKRQLTKLRIMQRASESENILQFFHFPLSNYEGQNNKFDFENITNICFIFDQSPKGVVAINNIGIK